MKIPVNYLSQKSGYEMSVGKCLLLLVLLLCSLKGFSQNAPEAPSGLTAVNAIVYFSAADATNGRELWRSDGTPQGTYVLKDILPGFNSSNPANLINVNGILFFTANQFFTGENASTFELWKSDGTPNGTFKLKDFTLPYFDPYDQEERVPLVFTASGNKLFFTANNTEYGYDLWRSDGTVAGTIELKKGIMLAGFPGISTKRITPEFEDVNGVLYFLNNSGKELWKSNGTVAGTTIVKDFPSFPDYDAAIYQASGLTSSGGKLYFTFGTPATGRELWKSDGTAMGTSIVKDITPGSTIYYNSTDLETLNDVNGTLLFVIQRYEANMERIELWKSNGTEAGTVLVKDFGYGSTLYQSGAGSHTATINTS
jgi:ELWxxDGT repeat protein